MVGVVLVVTGYHLHWLTRESARWLQVAITPVTLDEYYHGARFTRGYFSLGASMDTARYVKARTRPDQHVLVWGLDPLVYFLSGRLPPTRFGFRYPISTTRRVAPELGMAYYDELMRDLRNRPPRYFIVHHDDLRPVHEMTSDEVLRALPELWQFVQHRYAREAVIGNAHLWGLREADGY